MDGTQVGRGWRGQCYADLAPLRSALEILDHDIRWARGRLDDGTMCAGTIRLMAETLDADHEHIIEILQGMGA